METKPLKPGDYVQTPFGDGVIDEIPVPTMAWVQVFTDPGNIKRGIRLSELKSMKKDEGKWDPTMLTLEMVEAVSRVRMFGAKKYARNNFKITGFQYTRSLAAALRHIFLFLNGEDNDPESGLPHPAHAICCLEHVLFDMKHHPNNDDRK